MIEKTPIEWAVIKGLVVLKGKEINYRAKIPFEYNAMISANKWPNSDIDPTFLIAEEDFDKAFKAITQ